VIQLTFQLALGVSIPIRDLMNLEPPPNLLADCQRILFQSLLGIWWIWNCFFLRRGFDDLKFQSLLGIWWIWNPWLVAEGFPHLALFQSLLGIWWIWNISLLASPGSCTVSIPIRDLMNLELVCQSLGINVGNVSIPIRDLMNLELRFAMRYFNKRLFQSLLGIWWIWNLNNISFRT